MEGKVREVVETKPIERKSKGTNHRSESNVQTLESVDSDQPPSYYSEEMLCINFQHCM